MTTVPLFSPDSLLYADEEISLDVHTLRIWDARPNGALLNSLNLDKGLNICSLLWIKPFSNNNLPSSSSKRKRAKDEENSSLNVNKDSNLSSDELYLLIGTNKGSVLIYNYSENKIIAILELKSSSSSVSCLFESNSNNLSLWTCSNDGYVSEWQIQNIIKSIKQNSIPQKFSYLQSTRNFQLPDNHTNLIKIINNSTSLIGTSHSVNIYDLQCIDSDPTFTSIPLYTTQIHTLIISNDDQFILTAAQSDRFINILNIKSNKVVNILVAKSDIKSLHINSSQTLLVAITNDGTAELFPNPLKLALTNNSNSSSVKKSRRKSIQSPTQQSVSTIKLFITQKRLKKNKQRSKKDLKLNSTSKEFETISSPLLIESCSINSTGDIITISYKIQGSNVIFESVKVNLNKPLITLTHDSSIENNLSNNGSISKNQSGLYNEANAIIRTGNSLGEVELSNIENNTANNNNNTVIKNNEIKNEKESDDQVTLADNLRELALSNPNGTTKHTRRLTRSKNGKSKNSTVTNYRDKISGSIASAGTLTTVLTQALNTNDKQLLESVFEVKDQGVIKRSIIRLSPHSGVKLISQISEIIGRTPARAGDLLPWLKYVLIAHGGYFLSLPGITQALSNLHVVLSNRASNLERLLALQGRLELLQSQMELRKELGVDSDISDQDEEDDPNAEFYESDLDNENEEKDEDEDVYEKDEENPEDYDSDESDDELAYDEGISLDSGDSSEMEE